MTRLPELLRRRLERAAAQNRRSMNAEIINRLGRSFELEDRENFIESIAQRTATATWERFHVEAVGHQRDEERAEPAKPENSSQKDKRP
jgi:hypothetical protein